MSAQSDRELQKLKQALARDKTNRVVAGVIVVSLAIGITLVVIGSPDWKGVVVAIGSGLIALAVLTLSTEIVLRRLLVREVLTTVGIREDVARADIQRVLSGTSALRDQFADSLSTATKVDIMFISGSKWIDSHREALEDLVERGGCLRVLVPASDDLPLLEQLLSRFEYDSVEKLARDVGHTFDRADELRKRKPAVLEGSQGAPAAAAANRTVSSGVSIRRLLVVPTYSFYRLDSLGVMRVHEVRKEHAKESPVVAFGPGGSLWRFATADFDTLFAAASEFE